jgi:hypothetical protein
LASVVIAGIDEEDALEREDRSPILHRAEELAASGAGHVVELRKRVGRAEIVVEPGHDLRRAFKREAALLSVALLGDDADLGAALAVVVIRSNSPTARKSR